MHKDKSQETVVDEEEHDEVNGIGEGLVGKGAFGGVARLGVEAEVESEEILVGGELLANDESVVKVEMDG